MRVEGGKPRPDKWGCGLPAGRAVLNDTIVAVSTAAGASARGIVRMSGARAIDLLDGLTPDGSSERLATVDATFTSIFREFKIKLQALVKNNTALKRSHNRLVFKLLQTPQPVPQSSWGSTCVPAESPYATDVGNQLASRVPRTGLLP